MKLVLDDFYRDPDSLRELALNLEFSSRARNFPGSRSTRTVIPEEAARAFKSILKVDLEKDGARIPFNGCFQLMLAADRKRAYVHADAAANWAALVYLSPEIEPEGGTFFFRHKATGLTRVPNRDQLPERDFDSLQKLFRKDRLNPKCWQELDRVAFVYNRFVLYDAQLFHRNGKTWGRSPQNGRLTHNFFI